MGPFLPSHKKLYILVAVDYVSKWVEAVALSDNTRASVLKFVKHHILSRFGVPKAIISDNGAEGNRSSVWRLSSKYKVSWRRREFRLNSILAYQDLRYFRSEL